jgi:hypothetical protein
MKHLKRFRENISEKYEFEDFTMNDMEMVKELYEDGLEDPNQISIEMDLPLDIVNQILYTLRKRGDIV